MKLMFCFCRRKQDREKAEESKNKAKAVYGLLKGPITEEMPCSILQKHTDVTVYCDEEAYSLCK